MFKNKYLQQLQVVQGRIKACKASIARLKPPAPDSAKIEAEVLQWLQSLIYGEDPAIELLYHSSFRGFKSETLDYLHELGEYFINVADYHREEQKYKAELEQLQKEERILKEKLGID